MTFRSDPKQPGVLLSTQPSFVKERREIDKLKEELAELRALILAIAGEVINLQERA